MITFFKGQKAIFYDKYSIEKLLIPCMESKYVKW